MSKVYSPTQTETHLFCPMLRALTYQDGWEPRIVKGPRDLGGILGTGFAAGMKVYNERRQVTCPHPRQELIDVAVAAAVANVEGALASLEERGRVINDRDQAQKKSLIPRVTRAVTKAIEQDPIPADWRVVGAEIDLGEEYGFARLDLVVNDGVQDCVVDYKLKLSLKPEYRQLEIDRYVRSWQLFHYVWAWQQAHQPGEWQGSNETFRYYIVLVVLEPKFSIELLPFQMKPESLLQWEAFAFQAWKDMEAEDNGERIPHGQTKCEDRFGPCDFQRACWLYHYDPALMAQEYVQKGKR